MKKYISVLLLIVQIMTFVPLASSAQTTSMAATLQSTSDNAWKNFYVSPSGSDAAAGTKAAPFKTFARAQEEVRKYNQNMQGDIAVNVMPGRYELASNLEFTQADSGSNGYKVIWQGTDPDNLPTISGAKEVKGTWTEGEDGIWHVKADNLEFARELFINDQLAIRAQTPKKVYGGALYNVPDDYNHPHYGQQDTKYVGFYMDKSKMGLYENPEDIEIHSIMKFRTVLLHVDDIIQDPENENQVIVIMDRTFWNEYYISSGDAEPQFTPKNGFIVENAYELLDEPGEFYFNKKTKTLSYIPRVGEDLNSAEILVPYTEQLLYINGGNAENRIHDVLFTNIRFAHATNFELEEGNISGGQAEYHNANNTPWFTGRSTVVVDWAEHVDFESCVFYGLTATGLFHRDGVQNCEVIGNVFSDLGGTGYAAGVYFHGEPVEPTGKAGPYDAAWHAPWSASYHYFPGTCYTHQAMNTQRHQEHAIYTGKGWYSEPWAAEEGTKPWVMLELESSYDLERLEFRFHRYSTAEQRSNFEVLASKYRDFREYVTLKTYTGAASLEQTIQMPGTDTYRYFKFQKTKPGPFSLGAVFAWTYGRLEKGNAGVVNNCTVANNYFVRVAQQKQGSYPIWLNWTQAMDIVHNNIDDVPYSGISAGWGWDSDVYKTARDNNISKNRINDTMLNVDDGAGIYMLGNNQGSIVKENFITNTIMDGPAVYFDSGTDGITAENNVSYGTNEAFNMNTDRNIAYKGGYHADVDTFDFKGAKADPYSIPNLEYHPIQTYSLNSPPDEVVRIMTEAGVEEEWRWVESRIPEENRPRVILYGPDASDSMIPLSTTRYVNRSAETEKNIAKAILNTGTFGILPWHFAPETKQEMEHWLAMLEHIRNREDDHFRGHLEEQFALKEAVRKANDSVYHPSYEEMVAMCDEIKKDKNNFAADAVTAFNTKTADIYANNPQTEVEKAIAAVHLERAYEALLQKDLRTEITSVYEENATTQIDTATKTVTISLPYSTRFTEVKPVITTTLSSAVITDLGALDFAKGSATVSLRNGETDEIVDWRIVLMASTEKGTVGRISHLAELWTGGNPNVTKSNPGNAITIEPWFQPTMYSKLVNGSMSFSIKAEREDPTDGIGLIFSAQAQDLEALTLERKHTYYVAKIKGQQLVFCKVKAGEETIYARANDIGFKYGEYNDVDISVTEENGRDRVVVELNGEIVLDISIRIVIGPVGYFGILSKYVPVKLK